jgi:pimeloyl-ACP methyl ester carboxylesterase
MRTLFCEKIGTGSPLVFLHGFCETHQIWDSFIEELTPHFTILLFDLPGFGSSRPLNRQFTIDEVGREVIAELDHLKIDSCVVVGHSLGGYVALAMQSIRPTLFAGIVLFHSTVFADSEEKKLNRDKTIDFVEKYGIAPFVETCHFFSVSNGPFNAPAGVNKLYDGYARQANLREPNGL